MNLLGSRQLIRLAIGAVVSLLILGVFTPCQARADCSHGVFSKVEKTHVFSQLDRLADLSAAYSLDGEHFRGLPVRSKPARPLPCSGPSCSGKIPLPFSTAFSTVESLDHWGLPNFDSVDLQGPLMQKRIEGDSFLYLSTNPSRVFHPPRFSC
jgi:hypothetical protein